MSIPTLRHISSFAHKWAPKSKCDDDDDDDESMSIVDKLGGNLDMPLDGGGNLGSLALPSRNVEVIDTDEVTALALLPCSEENITNVPIVVGDVSGKVTLLSMEPCERGDGAGGRLRYRTLSVSVTKPTNNNNNDSMATAASSYSSAPRTAGGYLTSPAAAPAVTPATGAGTDLPSPANSSDLFRPRLTHVAFSAELDRSRYPARNTVQEKITQITPVAPQMAPHSHLYLAANDMLIKLFRVRAYRNAILDDGSQPFTNDTISPLRTFVSTHTQPIISTSMCADGATFLSLDSFKLLWWSLEASGSSASSSSSSSTWDASSSDSSAPVTLFDMSPALGEDVTEVATSACFHPSHASLFLNTSTSGCCRVGDLRDPPSRSNRRFSLVLAPEAGCSSRWTDNDLVGLTLQCLHGGVFVGPHHIVTRDYMSWCVWDMRQASGKQGPLQRRSVGLDCLAQGGGAGMESLFKSERVFDKFPLVADSSANSSTLLDAREMGGGGHQQFSPLAVATGLYGDTAVVWSNPTLPDSPITMYSGVGAAAGEEDEAVYQSTGCRVETTASETEVPLWKDSPVPGMGYSSAVDERSRKVVTLSMHGSELCFATNSQITRLSRSAGGGGGASTDGKSKE